MPPHASPTVTSEEVTLDGKNSQYSSSTSYQCPIIPTPLITCLLITMDCISMSPGEEGEQHGPCHMWDTMTCVSGQASSTASQGTYPMAHFSHTDIFSPRICLRCQSQVIYAARAHCRELEGRSGSSSSRFLLCPLEGA
jgi:hypothetical protein